MLGIEYLKKDNMNQIFDSIIEYIYDYVKQCNNKYPIKKIGKLLYTIQYKDLPNWDVKTIMPKFISYKHDIGSRKLSNFGGYPTMALLAHKVYHMIYDLHEFDSTYRLLYSCAFGKPKKLKLPKNQEPPYGVFYDDDATYKRQLSQEFPDGKIIYKNIKQPKGHFRIATDIFILTDDEQNYLKKLFE